MKKLLISGVGGSLFPYLFDQLNSNYQLFCIDSDKNVLKLYPDENIIIVPKVNDPEFEETIINIITKNKIDFYIPLIDEEILKAIDISQSTNIKVLAPNKEFVELALDKFKLMKLLAEKEISHIDTHMADQFNEEINYPLFLKPNIGRGSRGIKRINSKKEFEAYFILEEYSKNEILVQPFIDGAEYSVSVTVNNLNQLISVIPKKIYVKQGITKHAKCVQHKNIEDICKKIVESLKPCGSFNVQLKENNGELFIFEINPRYSTTLVMSIQSGVNEIDLNIKHYNQEKVDYIKEFKEISLIRRWENFFYE